MWCLYFGFPKTPYPEKILYTYEAQSPTLNKVVKYNKREVRDEVVRIVNESRNTKTTVGEALYMQVPFFANPKALWSESYNDWTNLWSAVTKYGKPFNGDDRELRYLQYIDREMSACGQYSHKRAASNARMMAQIARS